MQVPRRQKQPHGMRAIIVLSALLQFAVAPATADIAALKVTFAPSQAALQNPERGFWLFAAENFADVSPDDLREIRANGLTVAYGITRLDEWRDRDLPDSFLADLDAAFANARAAGIKIILRFAYNYPGNSWDYENAADAPLPVVLRHIEQLAPVISANADTIVVVQAGFIGAWGEGHTSSNGLDSPAAKAAIRDALLARVPADLPLQWRYPPDLLGWSAAERGRMGFHNDCFLSSPNDVGTYDEDRGRGDVQRAAMADLTDRTYFSGETCDAQAEMIRTGCADALAEGARFHLSALNQSYYEAFHKAWKAEGCYEEIDRRMGYRLRLIDADIAATGAVAVTVTNDGWARPLQRRPLVLTAYEGDNAVERLELGTDTLHEIGAGETVTLRGTLLTGQADSFCLSAPDLSPRLSGNPAFAVRFANADAPGQKWDAARAAFCFR